MRPQTAAWAAYTAIICALILWCVFREDATGTRTLRLELELPSGNTGRSEPILAWGTRGEGDLLFARRVDPSHVVFGFDSWGKPIVLGSTPVEVSSHHPLVITIDITQPIASPAAALRVVCSDRTNLEAASYHTTPNDPLQLGMNAIGSTWSEPELAGHVRQIRDRSLSSRHVVESVWNWLHNCPEQLIAVILIAIAMGWSIAKKPSLSKIGIHVGQIAAVHRWFFIMASSCAICFTAAITRGTFDLVEPEPHGVFYDYQATSLLHGHLDVPERAIAGEAFIHGGKFYGYFGPTPALLRLPFIVFNVGFGRLSRIYMLVEFVGSLTAAYLILTAVTRRTVGAEAKPTTWSTVVLLANVGLGSTLFFLGSRAMMYHEAILCGVTFALWSCWCVLRQMESPLRRWWIGALVCGLASVQARPPTGLFVLCLLGCTVLSQAFVIPFLDSTFTDMRSAQNRRQRALIITALSLAAVLSFNGLGYLKFRTFDGAPLRLSQPYTPARLAKIDGKSFHTANLPFGFYAYVAHANFRMEPRFPYFFIGAREPGRTFVSAKIDLIDRMLGLPYAMPGLFWLAVGGSAACFLALRRTRASIALVWIATIPMTLALFAAVAIAQRYTGDFCPPLITAAAFGIVAIDQAPISWRRFLRISTTVLTVVAILTTIAITLDYQGNWAPDMPEPLLRAYRDTFDRIDTFFGQRQLR